MSHHEHLVAIGSDVNEPEDRRLQERMARIRRRLVVFTTPQELAVADVRRCLSFCRTAELGIAGVLENMGGYVCPQCGVHADLFGTRGGERLAEEMSVPFLGRIPIDPPVVGCGDAGTCILDAHPDSPAAQGYLALARNLDDWEDLWRESPTKAFISSEAPR